MEMHPGWRNDKMLEACKNKGIPVTVSVRFHHQLIWEFKATHHPACTSFCITLLAKFHISMLLKKQLMLIALDNFAGIFTFGFAGAGPRSRPRSHCGEGGKKTKQEPRASACEKGYPKRGLVPSLNQATLTGSKRMYGFLSGKFQNWISKLFAASIPNQVISPWDHEDQTRLDQTCVPLI